MSQEAILEARRAAAPVGKRRTVGRGWVLPVYTALVIAYLFLPIAIMVLYSFNETAGRFVSFRWLGFTTKWYERLLQLPALTTSIKNSLIIAALSTLIATALGVLAALALTRYRFRGRSGTNLFVFLPLATPEIVLGASLLSLFISLNVQRGFVTILIAHVMFNISYVVVTVKARTQGFNREWEEAARDLGATPWTTFWTVTFPLILPGVLAAAALAFALSIDDFVITAFNAGRTSTFPIWVYGASRFGIPPQVNVMGTLIFLVGVLLALGTVLMQRRRI